MGACRCDEPRDTGHRAIQSLSHWAIVDSEPVVCVGFLTVGPRSPLPTLAPARRRRLREQGRHQFLPVTPEVEGAIHPDLDVDLVAGPHPDGLCLSQLPPLVAKPHRPVRPHCPLRAHREDVREHVRALQRLVPVRSEIRP